MLVAINFINSGAMVRLISDFDGVVVDLSERYYRVYRWRLTQVVEPEQTLSPLTKEEFWALKRQKTSQTDIGLRSGLREDQLPEFKRLRDGHVHRLENMVHDRLIEGSLEALTAAQSWGWEVMTVTMRRYSELDKILQLHPVLQDIFPGDRRFCLPDSTDRNQDFYQKPLLMGESLARLRPKVTTWMVGDTEADIHSAQSHNIPVIAVLSGIRDRQLLAAHNPDFIVENLWEAVQLIREQVAS
ncbi:MULTISPECIES: HAD family hydrolase [Cyanophyceae]|mgnify:CR=1 FL=1|uniref:HAD family hydrolase n=1 Tax=Cyanophyceae TaxID=3028117 RepID=UPI000A0F208E|nr:MULTISPECIES: HAD family hydrolase [Cyanophyceae]SMH41659.1 Phosphoglycolate phosphatase, HAD superfamily [Picosynechococcus sp. OG1]SMQ78613.1 Phosphoglycolate phosphatase, HAD superfamily [Synechococcus sp. 7002]